MQRLLNRFSIATSMILLTLSGFAAAALFAGIEITTLLERQARLVTDKKFTDLSTVIGGLTHEMQKERGASAGLIASQGQNFREVLDDQRILSDSRLAEFREGADIILALDIPEELRTQIEGVISQIEALPQLRRQVDSLQIDLGSAVGQVTQLNRSAIGLLPILGKKISNADAARAVQRHAILMTAKDISGLERAVGATGFARASDAGTAFPPAIFSRFSDLVKEQETLFELYAQIASDEMVAQLTSLQSSEESQLVASMRDAAFSNDAARVNAVAAEDWFATITGKINVIKALEDSAAAEIESLMQSAAALARSTLLTKLALIAGILLVVGGFAVFAVRGAARALGTTAARVEALASGDIESPIVVAPQSDLAKITTALAEFQRREVKQREAREHQRQLELGSIKGIERLTMAVEEGDFSARLRLRDLDGPAKVLGEGMNTVLAAAEKVADEQRERDRAEIQAQEQAVAQQAKAIAELTDVVTACSAGDFSQRMSEQGRDGVWLEVAKAINRIAEMSGSSLGEIRAIMMALSEGNLSRRMNTTYSGTFAEIAAATNTSLDNLSAAFARINNESQTLRSAVSNLKPGADGLMQRSESQAKFAETSAAATEQMSATVGENAGRLEECQRMLKGLEERTVSSQEVAVDAVSSITGVEGASEEMVKIVATIDEIAFQTNLLALNASVEAARAGEAGKGFAVVATEVRSLAGRCADASKQIGDLIGKSVESVKEGAKKVRRTGDAIRAIQEEMADVLTTIESVAHSGQEQARGVSELASSVSELENSAQANLSLARQNGDLMMELKASEDRLSQVLADFRSDKNDRTQVA